MSSRCCPGLHTLRAGRASDVRRRGHQLVRDLLLEFHVPLVRKSILSLRVVGPRVEHPRAGRRQTAGKFPLEVRNETVGLPETMALPLNPLDTGHVLTLCCVYWLLLVRASQYSPYPTRRTVPSSTR